MATVSPGIKIQSEHNIRELEAGKLGWISHIEHKLKHRLVGSSRANKRQTLKLERVLNLRKRRVKAQIVHRRDGNID